MMAAGTDLERQKSSLVKENLGLQDRLQIGSQQYLKAAEINRAITDEKHKLEQAIKDEQIAKLQAENRGDSFLAQAKLMDAGKRAVEAENAALQKKINDMKQDNEALKKQRLADQNPAQSGFGQKRGRSESITSLVPVPKSKRQRSPSPSPPGPAPPDAGFDADKPRSGRAAPQPSPVNQPESPPPLPPTSPLPLPPPTGPEAFDNAQNNKQLTLAMSRPVKFPSELPSPPSKAVLPQGGGLFEENYITRLILDTYKIASDKSKTKEERLAACKEFSKTFYWTDPATGTLYDKFGYWTQTERARAASSKTYTNPVRYLSDDYTRDVYQWFTVLERQIYKKARCASQMSSSFPK